MRGPQGWEWIIILLIVLVLFGASRLPALARSVGKSVRILKDEVKDGSDEHRPDGESRTGSTTLNDDDGAPRA